ncbi:alpha-amylase family glycosyl hydrolase [Pelodictyon phaeoclathratiforme]|uniref:alpha-amylase family glycosyl hydrolase n=1 Tax=Pelodictyon phaeoclathratiforme TaxID=34090 RepID=UPI0003055EF9|nr:alpha-amylase family glycosyl hydrolase [Pelodictyon phaeoclathratiforme]
MQNKEHFYVNRNARELFHLTDPEFLSLPSSGQESIITSERQTAVINNFLKKLKGADAKPVLPAQFLGMKLLHALFHSIMTKAIALRQPDFLERLSGTLKEMLSEEESEEYLKRFVASFPAQNVYAGTETPSEWLRLQENRKHVLEESFLVWLNNQNPALEQFSDLLNDEKLTRESSYRKVIMTMRSSMQAMGPVGPDHIDLAELLTRPIKHAPTSILEQLRYIRLNWGDLLDESPLWGLLGGAIDFIEDEDKYLFFEKIAQERALRNDGHVFEKEVHVPEYSSLDDANAPANYSIDSSWMPEVVMLAKSTYVWLDQLSKIYRRPVHRLQDIPDAELDLIAERGFTALWLIGLWQRSFASQKIKQLQGNPEAKASAYALENYTISDDIGGYEGYHNLFQRAKQRGIRLASDMVPNHTGMDSELVRNNPDWFLSSHTAPYYNYSYNGPNLSSDSRYGIYLEDGYWNRSDAAVTFKRVDYLTGDTRYIYHGNDGTIMPWNDTAQLNFLSAEVREGVIQQILQVARMFPIIRFDAAMVLAKRHIQRLWFPLHGHSAGVPSRSANAMSMSEFDAAIPEEFWREVVDRIHQKVPDTLLLAEAFWMLEGYFVRTLGMHRVYNSAFMHMLKKEDNANYRYLIKNTLEFDAEILKRYVNFMNNPDEDTAIAQFGRGDKYFGVCMMMLTMPGLPMFGHGQVEGFTEKYGMEYAKAYYDEQPDENLVGRHYREIFPIMKKRPLFAEVRNFFLYDVYSPEGAVNENIFAYSNRLGEETALVVFNNCFEQATGWIKTSVGYLQDHEIRQSSLSEGLNIGRQENAFVIFRDHASGMEFLRSCREIADNGLLVALDGYKYNVFLDFRVVTPSKLRPYDRLAAELNGRGLESIERAALAMSLSPLHRIITAALTGELLPAVDECGVESDAIGLFESAVASLLNRAGATFSEIMEKPLAVPSALASKAAELYGRALLFPDLLKGDAHSGKLQLALGLGSEGGLEYATLVRQWVMLDAVQQMVAAAGEIHSNLIDDWLMSDALRAIYPESGMIGIPAENLPDLLVCMLTPQPAAAGADEAAEASLLAPVKALSTLNQLHLGRMLQFDERHGKRWFREHRFSVLVAWLTLQELLKERYGVASDDEVEVEVEVEVEQMERVVARWVEASGALDMEAFLSGYEIGELMRLKV